MYLLHPLLLFIVFGMMLSPETARSLSPLAHWLIVLGLTPFLVTLCYLSYRYIESPPMKHVSAVASWLASRLRLEQQARQQQCALPVIERRSGQRVPMDIDFTERRLRP